jgi:hypothetical protein
MSLVTLTGTSWGHQLLTETVRCLSLHRTLLLPNVPGVVLLLASYVLLVESITE